ncbi:MAG: hypothetical protein NTX91_04330 [candidate division SR1 bacterium]|nr:hypothetical protein [candidate division SR1 bacterium]
MIHSYLDDISPYTDLPTWKSFDYEAQDIEETPVIQDNEENLYENRETSE